MPVRYTAGNAFLEMVLLGISEGGLKIFQKIFMDIIFHGAAREVGKSCIEIRSGGQRYLLDAGVKFVGSGLQFPQQLENIQDVDAVFLSHAHLDHSGALAFFERKRLGSAIYATDMTWTITKMLLEDERHLEQIRQVRPSFSQGDIARTEEDMAIVKYDTAYRTKDDRVLFRYYNSGHIPGGASILLELEGKKILYTADLNTVESRLMVPSAIAEQCPEVDVLVVEGTYGSRTHPERAHVEEAFLHSVRKGIENGASVLVPVFGVGRSQEVLMILDALRGECPIYLDGMARGLLDEVLRGNDPYVRNREVLGRMARYVKKVYKTDREKVVNERGAIIVSTSGMVEGGPAAFYARQFIEREEDSILLTGYQANGTRGRSLFDDHMFFEDGEAIPVRCHVRKFDFSAHLDAPELHALLTKIRHSHLVLQHGDPDALDALSMFAREHLASTLHVPQIGEKITIE